MKCLKYFLDTNVLLENLDEFKDKEFAISSVTLNELEEIKTNKYKTEEVKYAAREATRWLADHYGQYEVIHYCDSVRDKIWSYNLDDTNDAQIVGCAWLYSVIVNSEDVCFVTHDLSCRNIAHNIFGLNVKWFEKEDSRIEYTGFIEIVMNEEEMAYFYEHQNENIYGLLVNQYLIVKDINGEIVDTYRWIGDRYDQLYKKQIKSQYFDKLKPKDIYQSCLIDSIMNNTITAISAPPGAGKSLISLMCAMHLIESGKYDRLVILHNPLKARGSADMGYYTGSAIEKSLQNSIGQMLITKFGDRFGVDLLIQQGKLKIVSMADCRGMEIRDDEILYITETQNTTIDLIKLALSRVSSGAKVIIEGDYQTQVDAHIFEGKNNGLRRVIEVFRGHEEFGYIELQNIWRSKLAELAELL